MIQTVLLASLSPTGEGAMGPTGQARAPDGWESAFADVLVNFLLDRDGENQACLAGAAGVHLPVVPVSVETAFPVIETPEGQAVSAAAVETGSQPGLTAVAGAAPAFVPPAQADSPALAGAQTPAQAAAEPAAGEAAEKEPAAEMAAALPISEEVNQAAGKHASVETASDSGFEAGPPQAQPVEPAAATGVKASPDEPPALHGKAAAPVETGKVETPGVKPPDVRARESGAVVEPDAITAEPAAENEAAQPAAQAAEGPRLEAVGKPAESAAPRMDAAVEPAMPASTQPQPSSYDPQVAGQRAFQAVEGKEQSALIQMVRTIQTSVQQGQSSLRLQLYPQELGSIDVRLVSNAQGVGVTVFADQASTGRLLEMQISQLRASLQDAGVQISHLNVFQQGQQRQEAPADWNRRFYNRRQPSLDRQGQPAADAVEGIRLGQSLVDYRI